MDRQAYGIDFGTTNTSVAIVNSSNRPRVIPLDDLAKNPDILRTIIYVSKDGNFEFGEQAVQSYGP